MVDDDRELRIRELEGEVKRLKRLLETQGLPAVLRHQVRTTLGLMRSILRRSAETSASVETFAAHLEGRLDALMRVHTQLIATLDIGIDLHTLIANELAAHLVREGERVTLVGPSLRLVAKGAEFIGLAVHELVVNAVKYGALTSEAGRITVAWSASATDPPTLDLEWAEHGSTILAPLPTFRGFGVDALDGMLHYQFGAKSAVEFHPEGLWCSIRLPLRDLMAKTT